MTDIASDSEAPITDDAVLEALERIGKDDEDGIIQPEAVVEVASDPQSPLHPHFVWDDSEAAHQFRLVQARSLVRRISIVRPDVPAPTFVNVVVRRADGIARRGYVQTARAVADPDLYAQVLSDARAGLIAWRNRLSAFERAGGLVAQLDELIADITTSTEGN